MESFPSYMPLLGVLLCGLGFPLFKASVLAFGLLIGGGLGYFVAQALLGPGGYAVAAALLGGVLGVLLLRLFVRTGMFFLGAGLGGGIAVVLGLDKGLVLLIAAVAGVVSLFMSRWILILVTSMAGSLLIAQAVAGIQGLPSLNPPLLKALVALPCFLTGAAAQVWLTRKNG